MFGDCVCPNCGRGRDFDFGGEKRLTWRMRVHYGGVIYWMVRCRAASQGIIAGLVDRHQTNIGEMAFYARAQKKMLLILRCRISFLLLPAGDVLVRLFG